MNPHRITVAAIQPPYPAEGSLASSAATLERSLELLEEAAQKRCDFICLPEYVNCCGLNPDQAHQKADEAETLTARVADLARRHGTHIILPVLERRDGRLFNASHLIDPTGRVLFTYDKTHLTKGEREIKGVTPGGRLDVYESAHGALAVATCYDFYFPELFGVLARKGARMIFFPSLQRSDAPEAVSRMLSARAMDCSAFIVRSSYGAPAGAPWRPGRPYGLSGIVHPDGTWLANAGHDQGFALAVIDSAFEWKRRRCYGLPEEPVKRFLAEDRRPDLYGDTSPG